MNEAKPFCISKKEVWEAYQRVAEEVRKAIAARLRDCRLELHPEKTKIVYCKDELRKRRHDHEKLDFLGYEFRPRRSKSRTGKAFLNFSPAISTKAAKAIRERIRSWKLPKGSDEAIEELSRLYNPIIRGGSNITGGFTAQRSTRSNVNWTKSWSSGPKGNTKSYANISGGHDTGLLASRAGVQSCLLTGRWHVTRLHDGSCMSREAHVQFCERLGVWGDSPGHMEFPAHLCLVTAGLRAAHRSWKSPSLGTPCSGKYDESLTR